MQHCAAQEVTLHPSVEEAISKLYAPLGFAGYRTPLLLGVMAAAHTLETHPGTRLANKSLDIRPIDTDIPSQVLAELINVSMGVRQNSKPTLSVRRSTDYRDDACTDLEDHWNETFDILSSGPGRKPLVQLFVQNGVPVVARKGRGYPTALLLQDIAMGTDSIVYPAGSAVQVATRLDACTARHNLRVNLEAPEILPASAIRRMSFLRLTPYLVPTSQRKEHFDGTMDNCRPISELRTIASAALERSDVVYRGDISLGRYIFQKLFSES